MAPFEPHCGVAVRAITCAHCSSSLCRPLGWVRARVVGVSRGITLDRRHNCGVPTQPLREVRDHLSEVVDRVEHHHDRVVVTRNGRPAAVILSPQDLAQLEETIEVLSDNAALADIREADEAYARGDVVRGVDAVRRLRR